MGRRLPEGVGRSVMIFARVKPAEKARMVRRAQELDKSGSSIVRDALLAFLDTGGGTNHKGGGGCNYDDSSSTGSRRYATAQRVNRRRVISSFPSRLQRRI